MLYDKVNKKWLDNNGHDSKGNKFLNDREIEKIKISNQKYANYRHAKNQEFLLFQIFKFIKKQTGKKKAYIRGLEKENNRLKLVIESKSKWANYQNPNGVVSWNDSMLSQDHGVFKIGVDMEGQEIIFDFNVTANILIGGAPGGGKSNLILLVLYQAIKQGSKCFIADFKGTDFVELEDKTTVIYKHMELVNVLRDFYLEYEKRKELFRSVKAKNLKQYNERVPEKDQLKRQYLFIDEVGEAMEIVDFNTTFAKRKSMSKSIEDYSKSIARIGRAFGLNLIYGTQRADVTIIQGQTRDQFQKRICYQARKETSQIVIGDKIASTIDESKKGRAFLETSTSYTEVQTYYISDEILQSLPIQLKIVKPEEKKLKTLDEI